MTKKPFVTKELYRSELMRKDLNFLLGDKLNSMKLFSKKCKGIIKCMQNYLNT